MHLSDCIAKLSPIRISGGEGECEIRGITNDSRKIRPGFLFCAIRGAHSDGRKFVRAAEEAGAAAVVSDDPELETALPHLLCADAYRAWGLLCELQAGNPARFLHLHAVTGTNGKTTTATLLRAFLQSGGGFRTGLISTIEYDCGDHSPIVESARTTPDAESFQRILSAMHTAGCRHAVLEASSHGLHQHRMGSARFQTAIFTNLTGDHLDYHHDMESYYQAKKLLFTESLAEGGNAIINIDDPWGERLAAELHPEVRTLSMTKPASIRIELQEATASGTRFLLDCRGERMEIHAPLIGRYNVYNLSSAIAGALFAGVPKEKIPEIRFWLPSSSRALRSSG